MTKHMPVGKPALYNIKHGLNNLFGFAKAKRIAPNINSPCLPHRVGAQLVFGYGS